MSDRLADVSCVISKSRPIILTIAPKNNKHITKSFVKSLCRKATDAHCHIFASPICESIRTRVFLTNSFSTALHN